MAATISPIAPVVDKDSEAGESTISVFGGELMAVLIPDARLWEVSCKPVGIMEVFLEYLKVCDHLNVHFVGECCSES